MAHIPASDAILASIPRDSRYLLSQPFLDLVQSQQIGLQGLRLAHLIAHAVCRKVPDWHRLTVDQPLEGDRQECLVFRRYLRLERSKGNEAVRQGIAQLRQTPLFEWISFTAGNQWLSWRLRDEVFELLFDQSCFGYFDIHDLAKFSLPLDLTVYGDLGMVRGMKQPKISLSLDGYAASLKRSPEWHRMQPCFVRALQTQVRHLPARFRVSGACRVREFKGLVAVRGGFRPQSV